MMEVFEDIAQETAPVDETDSRKRYKGICPVCGKELYICKSLAMLIGINTGHGCCLGCKEFLHMEFNEQRQEMDLEPFDKYVEREQAKRDADAVAENLGYGGFFKDDE